MRILAILTVGLALAMLGPVSPAVAVVDGCTDGSDSVDIQSLTAVADGTLKEITVTMILCATPPRHRQ